MVRAFIVGVLCALGVAIGGPAAASQDATTPDPAMAAALFAVSGEVTLERQETPAPAWTCGREGEVLGHVASTWEIARSTGYSGQPLDVLVAIDRHARIAGARLVRHRRAVPDAGAVRRRHRGHSWTASPVSTCGSGRRWPARRGSSPRDRLQRVIRDAILRTARTVAAAYGLTGGGRIDTVTYRCGGLVRAGRVGCADRGRR